MIFVFPAVGVADFSIAPNGSVAGTVWHQYNNLPWISSFCALGGAATNCLVDSNWPGISRRWQAGDTVHMTATVPISGWSATGI